MSTTAPLLPVLRDEFSLNPNQIGLLASISGAGMVLIDLPAGRLILRFGTRLMALLGLFPVVLGPLIMATATSFGHLLAGSALSGIGFAVLLSNNIAALSGAPPHRNLGTRMGALSTAQLLGAAAGPLLSASVAGLVSWRGSYALVCSLAAAGLLTVMGGYSRIVDIRRSRDFPPTEPPRRRARGRFIDSRLGGAIAPVALVSFLYFVSIFSRSAAFSFLLPIVGRDEANLSIQAIGLLLGSAMLINVTVTLPAGALADRLGTKQVLIGGLALLVSGEVLMFLTPTAMGLTIATFFFGLSGPSSSLTYTLFGLVSRESSSPRSLGGFRLFGDLGALIGPLSMGLLLGQLGYRPALLSALTVGLLAIILLAWDIWFRERGSVLFEAGS